LVIHPRGRFVDMEVMQTSISLSDLLTVLLPAFSEVCLDAFELDASPPSIMLTLTSTQMSVPCPACHQLATRVHSHYFRTLADLPWAQIPVRLHLQVRKLFCDTRHCPRRIFTERLPSVVAPWARRTTRLAEQQRHIGLTAGGSAGARLGAHLTQPASRNTFLHLIRTTPQEDQPPPRVLGIDDWSQRKGHSYRTILVDLERHEPIELLPDREAETVARWLEQHPQVEIIARDRAGAYAEGASKGAPQTIQVADRFHLLRNLQETLTRVLEQHVEDLASLDAPPASLPVADAPTPPDATTATAPAPAHTITVPPAAPSPRTQEQAERRRQRRLATYEQVCQLHQEGWSLSAIAQQVGLDRNTVQKYVSAPAFPERQARPPRASVLDAYKPYILKRWNEGCHTGVEIWRDLEEQGAECKASTVFRYISRLRQAHGLPPKKRVGTTEGEVVDRGGGRATPRSLAWAVLRRPEKQDAAEQQRIADLRALHPVLDEAVQLTQEFAGLVRERQAAQLDGWLERARASKAGAFRSFAASLRRDEAAVRAGMSLSWSTGPVEGEINRLKLIKRTMFGRAKLDLLRQRVLYAA
jgi:transposase